METTTGSDGGAAGMSKKQLKRLLKQEKWIEGRAERRRRNKERRRRRHQNGQATAPGRKVLKRCTMEASACKQRIAVDMSFDDLMSERDRQKTVNQLSYCYAVNRRARNPVQFYIVNFNGRPVWSCYWTETNLCLGGSRTLFDQTEGNNNWNVVLKREGVQELFGASNVVYLTSESPNRLQRLDESKVYVIGGLVDHNHYKGKCLQVAQDGGMEHARLPIEEHLRLRARKVLTINQAFEILLRFTEVGDWHSAVDAVVPLRKREAVPEDA